MRSLAAAVPAVLAALALAAPSNYTVPPSLLSVPSIAAAAAAGVDIFGPIPSDATAHPQGHYTADEGTPAWLWVRAQMDIPYGAHPDDAKNGENDKNDKRTNYANIGIGMFTSDNCLGGAAWVDNVPYDVNLAYFQDMWSIGISYRGLRSNEQLDFSKFGNGDWCGQYIYSAGKMTPVGCWNTQFVNCFHLWVH